MEKTNASNPYKVVLLGESGVGKTCIIAQFTSGTFDANTVTSLTAQFIRKTMEFADNKNITFDIWDTAGQEKYRSLAKIFYKDAKAIVLVYDITSKDSFVQMKEYWYEQIKQQGNKDVIIAVAANKGDLYEKRVISNEEGEEFAKQIGAIFATTSAKDDSGILELFQNLGRKIMDPTYDASAVAKKQKSDYEKEKRKQKLAEEREGRQGTVKLTKEKNKKEKKGFC